MTCSALDGAAWNTVKSEHSGSEIVIFLLKLEEKQSWGET